MNRWPENFWPAADASLRMAFVGNRVERRSEHRTDDIVAAAIADPRGLSLVLNADNRLVFDPGSSPWLDKQSRQAVGGIVDHEAVLLGWSGTVPRLAIRSSMPSDELPPAYKAIDLRSVYVQGLFSAEDEGAAGQAHSLFAWHSTHRYCGQCGGKTLVSGGGIKRHCPSCGRDVFPRIDPVAIMLVTDGDRALLGRAPHFPEGMYSCLAGFVEHGETVEDTVRREVFEESGIEVAAVRYHASQPWPMPHSLMMGFFAEARTTDIRFDETELADCRWFEREEVEAIVAQRLDSTSTAGANGTASAPPRGAIAVHLMADWLNLTR